MAWFSRRSVIVAVALAAAVGVVSWQWVASPAYADDAVEVETVPALNSQTSPYDARVADISVSPSPIHGGTSTIKVDVLNRSASNGPRVKLMTVPAPGFGLRFTGNRDGSRVQPVTHRWLSDGGFPAPGRNCAFGTRVQMPRALGSGRRCLSLSARLPLSSRSNVFAMISFNGKGYL